MHFFRSLIPVVLFIATGTAFAAEDGQQPVPKYVGSKVCASCHEAETRNWKISDHAHAWMTPTPGHVDGDFDNAVFQFKGQTTRFFRKDGGYFIETIDVAGPPKTYKVVGVDGIRPLQQYLVETEPGKLQSFDVVWDQDRKVWYHLYADDPPPPSDGLHWTGPYKNWNSRCAECHSTGFRKNYSLDTRSYHSTEAEIGVGCEACHGPGEAHAAWAQSPDTYAKSPFPATGKTGLLVDFSKGRPETEIQQCAGCHSRREAFQDGNPLPGTPYHDAYRLSLLRQGLYHADGQIQDEVYVYGSFLQSKMYANGVRCTNCHEPHSGELKAEGNAVCTQCHSPAANPAFPPLTAKLYDDPSHTFHEAGTPGAQCKSCHMIERIYMGIDGRRDHSFRVPRPDLTVKIGTPNPCNDCHADKSASWATSELEKRFPDSTHRGTHYGEIFAAAWQDPGSMGNELLAIAEQDTFPGIVRATALDLLRANTTPDIAKRAATLIEDKDPIVRAAALALQQNVPPTERIQTIIPALSDPVRSVRMAAARLLIGAPIAYMPKTMSDAAAKASKEWHQSLANKADFPETHLVIGGTALVMRDAKGALAAFEEVTRLDPQMVNAWIMQIRIRMAIGDMAGAQTSLQKGLLANPDDANLKAYKRQLGG